MSASIIHFDREMDEDTIGDLFDQMRGMHHPKVQIASNGGKFEFFGTIGPGFSRLGYTAIGERVASAANVLFLLGHKRLALKDSTFFFHEVRAFIQPFTKGLTLYELEEFEHHLKEHTEILKGEGKEVMQEWQRNLRNANSWMLHFLKSQTGIDTSTIVHLMRNEITLTGREAVRYGFAQKVIEKEELFN